MIRPFRSIVLALVLMAVTGPISAETLTVQAWGDMLRAHSRLPLIVHVWGMTCGPCQLELPEWGKLVAERPRVPLILIEDDPVQLRPAEVNAHLQKAGLDKQQNWTLTPGDEQVRIRLDHAWAGELPLTLLIDGDGKAIRIVGPADFKFVRQWLDRYAPP